MRKINVSIVCFCLSLFAMASHAEIRASFDVISAGSCYGWAWDSTRPNEKLTVEFYVDAKTTPKPHFTAIANRSREDLDKLPQAKTMFVTPVPVKYRDGKRHTVHAVIRDSQGKMVALPGSPKVGILPKIMSIPKMTIPTNMKAIPQKSVFAFGCVVPFGGKQQNDLSPIAFHADEMKQVLSHSRILHIPIGMFSKASIDQLKGLKAVVDQYHLQIEVEMAGLSQWMSVQGDNMGKASAEQELSWMENYIKPVSEGGAGGVVDIAVFDDPLYRCLYPNDRDEGKTVAYAAAQIADAMTIWQTRFPKIKVFLGTNFPNWGWKGTPAYFNFAEMKGKYGRGEYSSVFLETLQILKVKGKKLDGVMVDNPADYAQKLAVSNQPDVIKSTDFIKRAIELEKLVKQHGLKYAMWINTDIQDIEPDGVFDTATRDRMYYQHMSAYAQLYRSLGGEPDVWVTFSWMKSPTEMYPETKPYTQAWDSLHLIKLLRKIK